MRISTATEKLVLQKPPQEAKILLFTALLIPLILLGFIVAIVWIPMGDGMTLWQRFHEDDFPTAFFLTFLGVIALLFTFMSLVILYQAFSLVYERIWVNDEGIHYASNLPTKLQGWQFINPYNLPMYQKDWSITWSAIKAVYIRKPHINTIPGNKLLILELDMGLERQDILLCQWTDSQKPTPTPCTPPDTPSWCVDNSTENLEWLRTLPLVQAIEKQGISVQIEKDIDLSTPFYTTPNRYSIATTLLFGFFTLFTALSSSTNILGETYIDSPFVTVNLVVGGIVALLFALWLRQAKIPLGYSLFAGFMVGASLFIAMPSSTLILNYLTDREGLQTYAYQYQKEGIFMPMDQTLPKIELWDSDYWQEFPEDTVHEFELRKGGLGFYQLHIATIEKKIRDYEKSKP